MTATPPVRLGRHVCGVAPTADARAHMAARWVRDGLAAGARVVWAEPPDGPLRNDLDRDGVGWRAAVTAGQLATALPGDVVGLGAEDDIPRRLAAARALTEQALADGFTGLRMGVRIADALAVIRDTRLQLAFEAAWEEATREQPLALLCLYGPESEPDHIEQALPAHPSEFIDSQARARVADEAVRVSGEVDIVNSVLLCGFLEAAVHGRDLAGGDLVLDLGSLSFIDVAGIRGLVDLARALAPRRVRVVEPPRLLRRVLDLAGWGRELDLDGETAK